MTQRTTEPIEVTRETPLRALAAEAIPYQGIFMVRLILQVEDMQVAQFALPQMMLPADMQIGDELFVTFRLRACRKCGCTSARGCVIGCEWVEWDLCSNCGSKILDAAGRPAGG